MELLLWSSFPGPPDRRVHEDVSSWWWWISNRQEGICWGGRSRTSCQQPLWLVEFPVCLSVLWSMSLCGFWSLESSGWRSLSCAGSHVPVVLAWFCLCKGGRPKGCPKSFRSKNHGEIQHQLWMSELLKPGPLFASQGTELGRQKLADGASYVPALLMESQSRGKSQLDCKHVKMPRKEKTLGRS